MNYRLIIKSGRKVYSDFIYDSYQDAVSGGEHFLENLKKVIPSYDLEDAFSQIKIQILPVKR